MNTLLRHIIKEELDNILSEQRHREKVKIKDLKRFNRKIDGNRILKVYNIRVRAKGRDKLTLNRKQVLDVFNREMPDVIKKEYYYWVIGKDVRKGKNIYSYNIMILNRSSFPELEKLSPLATYGSVAVFTTEQFEASTESSQDKSVSDDLDKNLAQDVFDIPVISKDKSTTSGTDVDTKEKPEYNTPEDKEAEKEADKIEKRTGIRPVENILAKYIDQFVRANENYKTYVKNTVYKIKKDISGTIVKSHWRSEIDNADIAWNNSTLVTPESIYNTPFDAHLNHYIRTADKNHPEFNILYYVKYINGELSKVHWMAHSPDVIKIIQKNPAWAKSNKLKKEIDAIGKKLWPKAIVIPSNRMNSYNKVMKRQIDNEQKIDTIRQNQVQGKSTKILSVYESPKANRKGDIIIVTNKNIFKKGDNITISGTTNKGPYHKKGLNTASGETYKITSVEKQRSNVLLTIYVMPERYDAPATAPGDGFNGSGKITLTRVAVLLDKNSNSWCQENGVKEFGMYVGKCAYLNIGNNQKNVHATIEKHYNALKTAAAKGNWNSEQWKQIDKELETIMNDYANNSDIKDAYYGTWSSAEKVKRFWKFFSNYHGSGSHFDKTFIYIPKNNWDDGPSLKNVPGYKKSKKLDIIWDGKKIQKRDRIAKVSIGQDPNFYMGPKI